MTTSTMNISLPEALKRFVRDRVKASHYSNPSDYVRSLIREDQRRVAAERLLDELVAKHLAAHPSTSPEKLDKLRAEYWSRWAELKTEIDRGLASLDREGGRKLDRHLVEDVKRRGRERLARSQAV
jgi:antitoxin ParD1/3/4